MKNKFNFDKSYSRRNTGSSKWEKLYSSRPDLGDDTIPMSVADMDFITSDNIVKGLCNYLENEILGYSKPTREYKQTVVKFLKNYHDYNCKEEWLVTSPGIVPALYTAVRAYTEVNDGVIIFTPIYPPFHTAVKNQNRRIEECPLINNNNYYEIDFKLLEKLASKEDTKLLLLCSPHNPGGRVWKKEELEKIAKISLENNIIVISDEIHSEIVLPGYTHTVFSKSQKDIGSKSVICTAASKTFNIAGLQCSNIFIENEELRELFIKANENVGIERANVLGMKATEIAYKEAGDWLEAVKKLIYDHHIIIEEFFEKYGSKFKVMKAESTFLAWVDFSGLSIEAEEFIDFLEEECDFFISEGSMYGDASKNFIRINLGLPTKKLIENLKGLQIGLKRKYNI